jgi:hypothetical protein
MEIREGSSAKQNRRVYEEQLPPVLRIHMFLGLPDPDPLVKGLDPDPALDPDPDPDPSITMQK